MHLLLRLSFVFLATGFASQAGAETHCRALDLARERNKVKQLLIAKNHPPDERRFLMQAAERQTQSISPAILNATGKTCGIASVRASIYGCTALLFKDARAHPELTDPAQKTGQAFWGKSNVSKREALFIGLFSTCLSGATARFTTP